MSEYSIVGKSVPRVDGIVKVTGDAIYADDLILPGMLHGKVLRSPCAHARILNIDTSKAEKLAGVRAVITGKDFPGIPFGWIPATRDQLPFAVDKVRFFGEAVAAVAADDEDIAEEALDLIKVEYEELPFVLSAEEAMKEGAPLVHDDKPNNIGFEGKYHWGDVEKGFRESDYIREETFNTHRASTGYIEPDAVLVSVDSSGRVHFQGSKQSPYITWRHLCRAMGLPLSKVRMTNPYIGGGFSGKHLPFEVDFAAVRLAQKTGRPVKLVRTQDEVLGFSVQRQAKNVWIKVGVKKDGTLVACDCRLIAEGGAYMNQTAFQCFAFLMFMITPYRCPNLRYEFKRVYTHRTPCGTVHGHASQPARYVLESILSMIADEIGIDQVEIRLKNAYRTGESTPNKIEFYDTLALTECIDKVAEAINWKERKANKIPNRGIGFGCFLNPPGGRLGGHFAGSAVLRVAEDGTVTLSSGTTEIGQGVDTAMAQMVAEVLGIEVEDVNVAVEDTDTSILNPGVFASRCTLWDGGAAVKAAEDARRQMAEGVAEQLGVKPEDLEFKGRRVYIRGNPDKGVSFTVAARLAYYEKGIPIYGRGTFSLEVGQVDMSTAEGGFSGPWGALAHGVEVEVDPETGLVKVLRFATAQDSGRPINPMLLRGQSEGSGIGIISYSLLEESLIDERGQPTNVNFLDYKVATSLDAAPCDYIEVINPSTVGPFGAKSGAEAAASTMLAAISNAIADATGVWVKDTPITPQKILKALKEKEAKSNELP